MKKMMKEQVKKIMLVLDRILGFDDRYNQRSRKEFARIAHSKLGWLYGLLIFLLGLLLTFPLKWVTSPIDGSKETVIALAGTVPYMFLGTFGLAMFFEHFARLERNRA